MTLTALDTKTGRSTDYERSRCAADGCHRPLPGRRMQEAGTLPRYCSHLCGVTAQPNAVLIQNAGKTA